LGLFGRVSRAELILAAIEYSAIGNMRDDTKNPHRLARRFAGM
jgi:hypothetical protein